MESLRLGRIEITKEAADAVYGDGLYVADLIKLHKKNLTVINVKWAYGPIRIETKDGVTCISLMEK